MITIDTRPHDEIEAEVVPQVSAGEPVIVTIEADGYGWDPDDPAVLSAVQAMLDDLARAADRQTAMIRADFARIAEAADALAVRLHATLAAAMRAVRIRAAAYWVWLRELLRSIARQESPNDPADPAYMDLRFLVASMHWPSPFSRPGAKEAHERAREAALLRQAERIAERWRVRPRERGTMRRVAHLLSQRRHDIAVLLGIDVVKVEVARPTREEEAACLTEEEKTAQLEEAFARLTEPAGRVTGTAGVLDPYDRLQPYRAGDGDGDGAGHMATKMALLQDGALVLALGDLRKPLVDVRWLRRIPTAVRELGAARKVEMCALHLPRKDVLAWVQAQAIKEAEHAARALVFGGDEHLSAADRSRHTHSLDALIEETQAGQTGQTGREESRPRLLGDASCRWARRDLGALSHDWERERREEDAAAAEAKSQAIRAALDTASADADLTPGSRALLDAVRRSGGDRAAAAEMLELTAAAERTAWLRLKEQLVPKLKPALATLPT